MTQTEKLTAEAMLSAPRRGAAVPSSDGKLALHTLSTHTFGEKTLKEVRLTDIATGESSLLSDSDKVHDASWIPGSEKGILYLKSGDDEHKGRTEVVFADGNDLKAEHHVVADIDAPISNLKLKRLSDESVAFVVTGLVGKDGTLFNNEAVKPKSTGRIFDSARVVYWNEFYKAERYSIWYNKLTLQDGEWKLAGDLINLMEESHLQIPGHYGPEDPSDMFDVSDKGIAFASSDLVQKKAHEVNDSKAYYVSVESFSQPPAEKPRPLSMPEGMTAGRVASIKLSADGSSIGFVFAEGGYVYNDKLYTASPTTFQATDALKQAGLDSDEDDIVPGGLQFAGNSDTIVFVNEKHGRQSLVHLKLQKGEKPITLYTGGSISGLYPLKEDDWDALLVSSSTYIESSIWEVIDVKASKVTSAGSTKANKYGLSSSMVSEFWYSGADDVQVQSFMVRPSDFDENKKYPWVVFVHGGPTAAHMDSWSRRWNVASWAEQGVIMILPNISGSTSFGKKFANRINGQYGGNPSDDLLKLMDHVESIPYLDQKKAVLAGASYGGYMVSWLFGDDIIKRFCCAIWHDGVYAIPVTNMQNDLLMDDGMFEGAVYPWINPKALEKWDPAKPERIAKWKNAPPTLIIHSEKDYRCMMADGIALMHCLHGHEVPTRFLTFSDEGHWVENPENSLVWHNTVWDWMKRCISRDIKRGDKKW